MKRFYKDFNQFKVRQIFTLLTDAGIPCTIKNELLQGASGEIPHHEALPEVWLLDAEWEKKANKLLAEFEKDLACEDTGSADWTCEACQQINEPQFRICWQCESPREEVSV
jgi:cytochrome c556